MLTAWREADGRARINLAVFALYLIVTALVGGASRADVLSQPVAYGAAVVMIGLALPQLTREHWGRLRVPVLLLAALAMVIAAQLVPLPPLLSRSLAGEATYARAFAVLGDPRSWQPVSLTPDLTLYSLIALLPPLAGLLGAAVAGRALPAVAPVVLTICAASALVGLLQVSGSVPAFYQVANLGSAIGLFANRNHAAALLVMAFPLLACWAIWPHSDPTRQSARQWIALCAAAILMPMLLITGSRAGLVFGVAAAALSFAISRPYVDRGSGRGRAGRPGIAVAIGALAVLVPVAVLMLFARDQALQRLLGGVDGEQRLTFVPVYLRMIADFFPWGSGFGSFDAVFRHYEPVASLWSNYLNHAHDDPVEMLIEGGLGAALVMAGYAGWLVVRAGLAWRGVRSGATLLAQAAAIMLVVLTLWSWVDYPLRTPTLSALAGLCAFLLTASSDKRMATRLGNEQGVR